jgi:hypothetical protein
MQTLAVSIPLLGKMGMWRHMPANPFDLMWSLEMQAAAEGKA